MNKLTSLLLSIVVFFTLLTSSGINIEAATADNNLWTNYVEEIIPNSEGIYKIQNAQQLAWVAKMTNEAPMEEGRPWSFKKQFHLMNSIDLSDHQWVPIGTFNGVYNKFDNMFYGVFEGNGHSIRGLTIERELTNENYQSIGLFGAAGSYSNKETGALLNYISDVYLEDVRINVTSIAKNVTYIGSIVGCGQINLYNCFASGNVKTKNVMTTGGLSGLQSQSMTKCVNNVNVNASFDTWQPYSYVGGVAGDFANASITACISNGDIMANNVMYCGGITGKSMDVIQASFSTSKIIATSAGIINVGNIVGAVIGGPGGNVLQCFATSDVNEGMAGVGSLTDSPVVEVTEKTLEYMKTEAFISDLINASKKVTASPYLAEKFMTRFQEDITHYTMIDGLPSSIQPKVYTTQVTANANIPMPTYTITIPATLDFGEQNQALEKYKDELTDQYGNAICVTQSMNLSATGVANLFDDLADGKDDYINVTVSHEGKLIGTDNQKNEVPFVLKQGNQELVSGATIASFYNDVELGLDDKPLTNTATADITINRADITKLDRYGGKLTFTISIADR